MLRVILTWIVILNTSTITLSDAMLVVDDDAIELGDIGIGKSCKVEIESADSIQVVFRLGEEWIGADMLPLRDTIKINDKIETFEVEILEVKK